MQAIIIAIYLTLTQAQSIPQGEAVKIVNEVMEVQRLAPDMFKYIATKGFFF